MIGTLDTKRGIVNVMIHRAGRKTYLSMDQALADLALALFGQDKKAFQQWLQARVALLNAEVEASVLHADVGGGTPNGGLLNGAHMPASGFSRMVQREILHLARERIRLSESAAAEADATESG